MSIITHSDYYKLPSLIHKTGDIWTNLPTLGLFKASTCSGLIITPACDLANQKVETLTYLPIISVSELLCSRFFYPNIRNSIIRLSKNIKGYQVNEFLEKNHIPSSEELRFLREEFSQIESKNSTEDIIKKILIGIELASDIITRTNLSVNRNLLKGFFSDTDLQKIIVSIIRNSYSLDLHFLPSDYEEEIWSKMKKHSVVMFRYPITAPIEIFEIANDVNCQNWKAEMNELSKYFKIATQFESEKPLKTAHLEEKFLSDLLTRFVSLYVRIGSPDFDETTISKIYNEI